MSLALAASVALASTIGVQSPAGASPAGQQAIQFGQFQACHVYLANPPPCQATNADDNEATDPYFGGTDRTVDPDRYQRVPVGVNGEAGDWFYVGYSAKQGTGGCNQGCDERTYNVSMSVFELACSEPADVLLFGTGYGCRHNPQATCCQGAQYTPADDAQMIHQIIRNCLRLGGTVKIDIVVPHSHADHISPESVHALEAPGFVIRKIFVHRDDEAELKSINQSGPNAPANCGATANWTQADLDKMVVFGTADGCVTPLSPMCEQHFNDTNVKSFATTLGRVWFRERDGHTGGSVDLVLDFGGSEADRYVVYGSVKPGVNIQNNCCQCPSFTCPPLPGVKWAVDAHGNFVLPP